MCIIVVSIGRGGGKNGNSENSLWKENQAHGWSLSSQAHHLPVTFCREKDHDHKLEEVIAIYCFLNDYRWICGIRPNPSSTLWNNAFFFGWFILEQWVPLSVCQKMVSVGIWKWTFILAVFVMFQKTIYPSLDWNSVHVCVCMCVLFFIGSFGIIEVISRLWFELRGSSFHLRKGKDVQDFRALHPDKFFNACVLSQGWTEESLSGP